MQTFLAWAQQNPEMSVPVVLWFLYSAISFFCSVLLRVLRAAYPEPVDQLPRWMRGLEAGLDEIAMNSKRSETMAEVLKKAARKP